MNESGRAYHPPPADGTAARTPQPLRFWQRPEFRQVVVWGTAGLAALAGILVVVVLVMGGSNDDGLAAASGTPVASPSDSASATESESAVPSPTATPTAVATASVSAQPSTPPAPSTSADPPAALGLGWGQVLTELNLRNQPGTGSSPVARLPIDEVVWVVGGPEQRDGFDWYQVKTLEGATGWIASGPRSDSYARLLSPEDTLVSCGKVQSEDGIRVNGLRPGPLDGVEEGGFALSASTGEEQCVTYALEGNRPVAYLRLLLEACGAPTWDGTTLTLKPTTWGDVIPEYKVKRTTVVPEEFLKENSVVDGDGMSNKLKLFLLGGQLTQPFGCLSMYIEDAGSQVRRELETWLSDCLVMTEDTTTTVSVRPASGGTGVTFQKPDRWTIRSITINQPTTVNLFSYTHPDETLSMGGFGSC